jgi:hypothetical protein
MFNKVSNKLDGKGEAPKRDNHEKAEFRDGYTPDVHDSPLIQIDGMERPVPKDQDRDDKPQDIGNELLDPEGFGPEPRDRRIDLDMPLFPQKPCRPKESDPQQSILRKLKDPDGWFEVQVAGDDGIGNEKGDTQETNTGHEGQGFYQPIKELLTAFRFYGLYIQLLIIFQYLRLRHSISLIRRGL